MRLLNNKFYRFQADWTFRNPTYGINGGDAGVLWMDENTTNYAIWDKYNKLLNKIKLL